MRLKEEDYPPSLKNERSLVCVLRRDDFEEEEDKDKEEWETANLCPAKAGRARREERGPVERKEEMGTADPAGTRREEEEKTRDDGGSREQITSNRAGDEM